MRIERSLCVAVVLAVSVAAPSLTAQGGILAATGPVGGITGVPYSGTRKNTHAQTLANGTKITRETIVKEARDSVGRTYMELSNNGSDFTSVVIFDPVNRTNIFWSSRAKEATVNHIPDPRQIRSDAAAAPRVQSAVQPARTDPEAAPQVEELGTETISGVTAIGRRVTRIIPAGRQGNDQPITTTTETWRSSELRLVVRQIVDDPRTGTSTSEFTEFQQSEPDPALFQVPEGYTVKEQFPGQNQN